MQVPLEAQPHHGLLQALVVGKAIRRSSAAEVGPIARQEYAVALHHAAELLLLPCPTLSSDRSRMEKKNRVTANPYRERAKLEPKKLLRLAASQPIDGRWLERVLERL